MNSKKIVMLMGLVSCLGIKAQNIKLFGIVSDSLHTPLLYANVIAKPTNSNNESLKFSITGNEGAYNLFLKKGQQYTITASYMGFQTSSFLFTPQKDTIKNIILVEAPNKLEEVVIEIPVIVKQDTIIYNANKFVTGEERKLKNVLKKLPGVEVDKNGSVTVLGKKVSEMLVEGKKFFGGDSKLAVENIPANAIDRVQVIENYNEIAFLKNLSDSDKLAMNIQLKKDKKRFVFGDIETGKGNDEYFKTHGNLFYYSPKTNINFIGNINNTNDENFTYSDYINFRGGMSTVLEDKSSLFNNGTTELYNFSLTKDIVKSNNKFGAFNVMRNFKKVDVSGYAIYSTTKNEAFGTLFNEYSTGVSTYNENKKERNIANNFMGVGMFKLSYMPSVNNQLQFETQVNIASNNSENYISSEIANVKTDILELGDNSESNINQSFEWHKKLNRKHTISFGVNYLYKKEDPKEFWESNQEIFQGLIPVLPTNLYAINELKNITLNNLNVVAKHYWVLNKNNHIYTTIGYKYYNEKFLSDSWQVIANKENNFNTNGFGNNLLFEIKDFYGAFHYKYRVGDFTAKQGVVFHKYNWNVNQISNLNKSKILVLPDIFWKYKFSNSENLQLSYNITSKFTDASKYAKNFYLRSYNSVFKGNAQLENELFHSAQLYYNKFSLYRGLMLYGSLNFTKTIKGIKNSVQYVNTNQYLFPELLLNPQTQWNLISGIKKRIFDLSNSIKIRAFAANYNLKLDDGLVRNKNRNISVEVSSKTLIEKFPSVEVGVNQSLGNYASGNVITNFTSTEPFFKLDFTFFKNFDFSFDYTYYNYKNKTFNQTNRYSISNSELYYKNENSAWSFKLSGENLWDVTFKRSNSFSAYIISDSKTYIFPRTILFSIGYNL